MPAPPISALEQLKQLDPQQTQTVRERFLREANESPGLYEKSDLDTIATNSWQIERFLLESKLENEKALKALHNAMKWRKAQGIHEMQAEDFPAEYYQTGYIVQYGRDVHDAKVIYFRAGIHKKTTEWNEFLKKFFIYQIEQVDLHNDGKGVTMVIDCSNIGISNLDLDLLKFIVTSFSQYYPKLFDAIIIHELPFLLQYVFKMVQGWLPEDDRKFFHLTNKKDIHKFISLDQLPKFMQGNNAEPFNLVPDNVLDAQQFVKVKGDRFGLKKDAAGQLKYLKAYI